MRRTERLDPPRVWLPRGGRRGWLRAAAVGALVVTAAVILLFNHHLDAGQQANSGSQDAQERTPAPTPATGSSAPAAQRPDAGNPDAETGPEGSRDGPAEEGTAANGSDAADPYGTAPSVAESDAAGSDTTKAGGADAECRPGGAAPPSGAVGFPLRLADPVVLAVVRPGQRVDVLVRTDGQTATVLAGDVSVLCGVGAAAEPDGVLYLAVSQAQARALAALGPGARVSVTVRSPG